jgi:ribosomal protein S18 acetylase RimI-like enzyme
VADVSVAGRLLDEFNTEFDAPTPGSAIISDRLAIQLGAELFVVLAGDPAVGIAVVSLRPNVWFDGPVALLDELYVAPLHRSQGLGTRLLTAVRAEAVRRGVEYVEINVDESDHDAQRFYERHGFTVVDPDSGERAFYYSGPAAWPDGAPS